MSTFLTVDDELLSQRIKAATLKAAEIALVELVKAYQSIAPKLAEWLDKNVPEGLAVFSLPETHRMRTSNQWSARCNRKSSAAHKRCACSPTRRP